MIDFNNIPKKYVNQLAKLNKIVFSKKETSEVIEELIEKNQADKIEYLNEQFKYSSLYLTLCKPESNFPDKSSTAEKFIAALIKENQILKENLNSEWEPRLSPVIKICSIKQEGSAVYLKFVEEVQSTRKSGYSMVPYSHAKFVSAIIHFDEDEIIQLRCSGKDVKKYAEHVMKLLGFAQPYKWFAVPKLTKQNAVELCAILAAGVASRHISIPSNVGGLKFIMKKGVNLAQDTTYTSISKAIEDLGLPTDQTMDETCFFTFVDPNTGIKVEATFEVNIQKGNFKFTSKVPEAVFDHVLEALVRVNKGTIIDEAAASASNN